MNAFEFIFIMTIMVMVVLTIYRPKRRKKVWYLKGRRRVHGKKGLVPFEEGPFSSKKTATEFRNKWNRSADYGFLALDWQWDDELTKDR